MNGVAVLVLFLAHTHLSHLCQVADFVLVCSDIPSHFDSGFQTLLLLLKDVEEINSTVLQSRNLASISRLVITNAGVTRIAKNAFSSFLKLRNLNLSDNKLSHVNTDWFANPAALSELHLTGNQIEFVNKSTFNRLTNLTKLILNKNGINHVHLNSFSSQSLLADLDLSENKLTWISPQVFSSLGSLRSIRLDGNPWNCSCDHSDFVAFIKELKSRSQLERPMNVICETPPPLKGQPVWKASVCPVSPPSLLPTRPATSPTPTVKAVTVGPQPSSKTETSFLLKPTEALSTISSHTETFVTSSLSGTDTSVHPKPTNTPVRPSKTTGPPGPNIVSTLFAVIAVLCVLLFVVCFLAVLHRRKRRNKTVLPGCLKEKKKKLEAAGRSSNDQCEGCSDSRDPEMPWRKSFTGVRAKSANAAILTSPFGLSEKDKVTFKIQIEAPSESSEKPGDKKQKLEADGEAAAVAGGGIQVENQPTTDSVKECERREDGDKHLYENPECAYVNTDIVPYLSIGTNQNNPSPEEESTQDPSQRAKLSKVIGRVSTWPPTAAQWQARCKMKEGEEEDGEGFPVRTQSEALKLPDEVEETINKMKQPESSEQSRKEDQSEKNHLEAHVNLRDSLILRDSTTEEQLKKERMVRDPDTARQTKIEIGQNQELKSAENAAHKSSSKAEVRSDQNRAVTGRQRAENRAAGSKAPSGGTSPDDETLLSGNEYAFMDLLHEVSQNNGRWTRERWKQMHVNKQRR